MGSISREDIVAAATGIVTAGGHEEMSIRSLAASIGVARMWLYRLRPGREDTRSEDAGRPGRQLAACTTTGQFIQGLRYLLGGISGRAGTLRQGGT